jgi:hypothetical protein
LIEKGINGQPHSNEFVLRVHVNICIYTKFSFKVATVVVTLQMEAGDLEKPRRVVSRSGSSASARGVVGGVGSSAGVRMLEKKNKQLNSATKELEEKVKSLRERTRTLPKVGIMEKVANQRESNTCINWNAKRDGLGSNSRPKGGAQ